MFSVSHRFSVCWTDDSWIAKYLCNIRKGINHCFVRAFSLLSFVFASTLTTYWCCYNDKRPANPLCFGSIVCSLPCFFITQDEHITLSQFLITLGAAWYFLDQRRISDEPNHFVGRNFSLSCRSLKKSTIRPSASDITTSILWPHGKTLLEYLNAKLNLSTEIFAAPVSLLCWYFLSITFHEKQKWLRSGFRLNNEPTHLQASSSSDKNKTRTHSNWIALSVHSSSERVLFGKENLCAKFPFLWRRGIISYLPKRALVTFRPGNNPKNFFGFSALFYVHSEAFYFTKTQRIPLNFRRHYLSAKGLEARIVLSSMNKAALMVLSQGFCKKHVADRIAVVCGSVKVYLTTKKQLRTYIYSAVWRILPTCFEADRQLISMISDAPQKEGEEEEKKTDPREASKNGHEEVFSLWTNGALGCVFFHRLHSSLLNNERVISSILHPASFWFHVLCESPGLPQLLCHQQGLVWHAETVIRKPRMTSIVSVWTGTCWRAATSIFKQLTIITNLPGGSTWHYKPQDSFFKPLAGGGCFLATDEIFDWNTDKPEWSTTERSCHEFLNWQ